MPASARPATHRDRRRRALRRVADAAATGSARTRPARDDSARARSCRSARRLAARDDEQLVERVPPAASGRSRRSCRPCSCTGRCCSRRRRSEWSFRRVAARRAAGRDVGHRRRAGRRGLRRQVLARAEALGERYRYDARSRATVARLSVRLFDELQADHGLEAARPAAAARWPRCCTTSALREPARPPQARASICSVVGDLRASRDDIGVIVERRPLPPSRGFRRSRTCPSSRSTRQDARHRQQAGGDPAGGQCARRRAPAEGDASCRCCARTSTGRWRWRAAATSRWSGWRRGARRHADRGVRPPAG